MKSKIGYYVRSSPYKREFIQKEMNISRATLTNWCSGKTHPDGPQLFRLAKLLDVKVDDLYEEEDN
ncbi:helix-turn-helix transcriptional regulator [Peribacillus frigoritolerans]|uniref:helix-turn-helix transcriptional regulator n=1 Tax=Peribacillus frigoritolerans TaxID=450367 RepID=UPI002EB52315|nr:helix-turn-helix transcriptional regulator [Peribacillus frigoritolerans]